MGAGSSYEYRLASPVVGSVTTMLAKVSCGGGVAGTVNGATTCPDRPERLGPDPAAAFADVPEPRPRSTAHETATSAATVRCVARPNELLSRRCSPLCRTAFSFILVSLLGNTGVS